MSKTKAIKIESYECPKCKAVLKGSYEHAQEHVDVLIDTPLPLGMVYSINDKTAVVIIGRGNLVDSECILHGKEILHHFTHTYNHKCEKYSFMQNKAIKGNHLSNSKLVKQLFQESRARFLSPEEFRPVQKYFAGYKEADSPLLLKLKRIVPSLEKIANTKNRSFFK